MSWLQSIPLFGAILYGFHIEYKIALVGRSITQIQRMLAENSVEMNYIRSMFEHYMDNNEVSREEFQDDELLKTNHFILYNLRKEMDVLVQLSGNLQTFKSDATNVIVHYKTMKQLNNFTRFEIETEIDSIMERAATYTEQNDKTKLANAIIHKELNRTNDGVVLSTTSKKMIESILDRKPPIEDDLNKRLLNLSINE